MLVMSFGVRERNAPLLCPSFTSVERQSLSHRSLDGIMLKPQPARHGGRIRIRITQSKDYSFTVPEALGSGSLPFRV